MKSSAKSSALLFLLFFITFGLQAAVKSTDIFVVIGDETYYCDKVQVGKTNTWMYKDGKRFLKVPTHLITAYAQGGKFYEYLPVIDKDGDTAGWAFMQFITSRNGSRLYRYCSNCLHYDPVNGIIAPEVPVYRYYTFKSGKFVSVTDDQNLKAQLSGFGVRVIV